MLIGIAGKIPAGSKEPVLELEPSYFNNLKDIGLNLLRVTN